MMGVSCLITLFGFIKFFLDPDPFNYFRYSFRYVARKYCYELPFNHCLVYATILIVTISLFIVAP